MAKSLNPPKIKLYQDNVYGVSISSDSTKNNMQNIFTCGKIHRWFALRLTEECSDIRKYYYNLCKNIEFNKIKLQKDSRRLDSENKILHIFYMNIFIEKKFLSDG